jgi:HTH-type transcriptional regulator/antitoxin HipB
MRIRTPRDIGALIRDRRRQLGLDQTTLAARVGVSRKWIVDVEKGKPGAQLGLVLRTLNALDIALEEAGEHPSTAPGIAIPAVDINAIVEAARRRDR